MEKRSSFFAFTRPSELRLAQWSEFNLQQAEWHIPAERMKMAATHWVPWRLYSQYSFVSHQPEYL